MRSSLLAFLILMLIPFVSFAQAQKGTIVGEDAQVYRDPDFDAPVIATLKPGQVFAISKGKKGPFYKIRLKRGTVGWIADSDIRAGVLKVTETTQAEAQEEKEKKEAEESLNPFFASRYWGPVVEYLNYTEDTMGQERSAGVMFYGLKWSGFNTLFSGEVYTDANLLFSSGAPSYYKDATGQSAGGYIINANFLLQTVTPVGTSALWYYGFGPMLRYSHFDLHLYDGTQVNAYSADDMALGVVFDVGAAYRISRKFSVRTDAKYYWEKNRYFGIGLGVGYDF